ncbi:hypothetical protein ACIREO_23670 [Streptomyces sp. NPDC102441]|uniref:hypothetical protein n=1 Tax=Streptomyces sp. NPDC102441 TaxID=3366176 RepID=UPI00381411D5
MTDHTTPHAGASSEVAELRALNRRLVQALQAKTEMPMILVPIPQTGTEPATAALVGILLVLWRQARIEADAYQAWIRQPTPSPATDAAARDAAEAAQAHLGSRHSLPAAPENDSAERSRPDAKGTG